MSLWNDFRGAPWFAGGLSGIGAGIGFTGLVVFFCKAEMIGCGFLTGAWNAFHWPLSLIMRPLFETLSGLVFEDHGTIALVRFPIAARATEFAQYLFFFVYWFSIGVVVSWAVGKTKARSGDPT